MEDAQPDALHVAVAGRAERRLAVDAPACAATDARWRSKALCNPRLRKSGCVAASISKDRGAK
jgi:hypothetical protein